MRAAITRAPTSPPPGSAACNGRSPPTPRLWIGLDPVDAYVHVRAPGPGTLGGPDPGDLERRLDEGDAGLKLHPAYDSYPADTALLDPYLTVAAEARVPVTVHSAAQPAPGDVLVQVGPRSSA